MFANRWSSPLLQPLDLGGLAQSRRNLYETGAFSIVDITREDVEGAEPAPSDSGQGAERRGRLTDQKAVRVKVSVREVQPYQLRYGASYDTERGIWRAALDVSNHNSLGKARVIGLTARVRSPVPRGRLYISQPSLRYGRSQKTGSLYFREELNPSTELTEAFDVSRRGAAYSVGAGVRECVCLELWVSLRASTYPRTGWPARLIDQTLTVSPLTSTITRETRDEVLDASRGSFLSQAFAYSPAWLGSDLPFQVLRAVFPLHPAAGATASAVHDRAPPPSSWSTPWACVSGWRTVSTGQFRPVSASTPAAAQHCAASLKTRSARSDLGRIPLGRQCSSTSSTTSFGCPWSGSSTAWRSWMSGTSSTR